MNNYGFTNYDGLLDLAGKAYDLRWTVINMKETKT